MWEKEISKSNKNEDTPGEGDIEMSNSSSSKANNLVENTSTNADKVVVATYVFNEGDDCEDNKCEEGRQKSDINHLLSTVHLRDDTSASLTQSNEATIKLQNVQKSVDSQTSPIPATIPSVSTAANTSKTAELSITIDCNELPYKDVCTNLQKQTPKPSSKPAISVKYFSPILPSQTLQNETVSLSNNSTETEHRNEHLQSGNVAGPQTRTRSPSVEHIDRVAQMPSPNESVEDLILVSELRACSPTPSNITIASTHPTARSANGRRVECSRHIRRPPKEPEEYVEALFPHIQRAHKQIRQALLHAPHTDVKDNALLKRKMLEVIQLYTNGCKKEFERAITSLVLCRRLKRNIMRLLDLFHDICLSCREQHAYLYYISQLIGIYNSLEIRLSFGMTRSQKCALIHRIAHLINKHLLVKDESLTKENILRMFLHMPDMYSARFIMEPLFNKFLQEIPTSSNTWGQKELPDKTFVQYIVILHLWKEMLRDPLEQVELINRAQHYMCPTKTLHANPMYANHLPIIHTRKHAVKDILNSLKFFHDLRNAAICDDSLHDGDDEIEIVIDEVINTPLWDFGVTYQSETKQQRPIKSRVTAAEPAECIDLTIEDDEDPNVQLPDNSFSWLNKFKEAAAERVSCDESEKVICLDSDSDGELFSGSILDPAESYQDCDAFDTDYTSLDSCASDDRVPSDEETLPATAITNNCLRTYLTPKSKKQFTSYEDKRIYQRSYERARDGDGEGDCATVGAKSIAIAADTETGLPLIVNSFTVRGKQNMHLFNSPRYSLDIGPERFGNEYLDDTCNELRGTSRNVPQKHDRAKSTKTNFSDNVYDNCGRDGSRGDIFPHEQNLNADTDEDEDDEYQSLASTASSSATTLGKVIYSQALLPSKQRLSATTNAEHEESYKKLERNKKDSRKQLHAEEKRVKKQVKFNDKPIGPTRRPNTKLPIKPAIQLSKIQSNNQPHVFSNSPQPRFASPSSSTSSTTESLKQMAQKEHINAIPTLFSSYKINKPTQPPLTIDAPPRASGSNTTLKIKHKNKAGPKSMHISRKAKATLDSCKRETNSPLSVANSLSPIRSRSTSPTDARADSPIITAPEIAADPKLNKKCAVILQENEEVIKYKREEVAFINNLLEKQREMQRQRALKRQEFQNILKQKRDEGKRLIAEIAEIKKQQAEANEKALQEQEQQKRGHRTLQQQSSTLLNRKRLLVKGRNVKFNTKPKVRSRSTSPNRKPNENEDEVAKAENEAERNGIAATQAMIGEAFDLVTNNKTLIEMGKVEKVNVAERDTKVSETQNKKLNTAKCLYADASNTKMIPPKVQNQSTKASSYDIQPIKEAQTELSITTTQPLITAQKTPATLVAVVKEAISTSNNTILTGKSQMTAPATFPIQMEPYARSMTPIPSSVSESTAATMRTAVENELPGKAKFACSTPLTSHSHLARAPSLSPSIFTSRNRVEVRQSMQDPSSNTDFPTSITSWLSNALPRTKPLKVRLKRLQHFNIDATPPSSPEKLHSEHNGKPQKSIRPASAMPVFFKKQETKGTSAKLPTDAEKSPKVANKNELSQLFNEKPREQLPEMNGKCDTNLTKTIENAPPAAPKKITSPSPSLKITKLRGNKGVGRKPHRKLQPIDKKIKLTKKTHKSPERIEMKNVKKDLATTADIDIKSNIGDYGNNRNDDTAEKVKSGRKKKTRQRAVDSASVESANTSHDIKNLPAKSNEITAERTNLQQQKGSEGKQKGNVNDVHDAPMDVVVESVCEETIANAPLENTPMDIDCNNSIESKLKRDRTHGAIVTQVVDVTPGRHIKESLLGDLLLAKNAVLNTKVDRMSKQSATVAATPTIDDVSSSLVKSNLTIPVLASIESQIGLTAKETTTETVAVATNEDTTNINKLELQNANDDTMHLPKANEAASSSKSIMCSMQFAVDPKTVIGLKNDILTNNTLTPNENSLTTDNAKPITVEDCNTLDSMPNADKRCLSEDEESSSDCLLSQLSKRVRKMRNMESIVDANTVRVIKDATMTLMSFEVAPTLPAYLLNGESRDIPTPPAISTRAPTPIPIGKSDAAPGVDPTEPTLALTKTLVKEMPQTSQTANTKVLTDEALREPINDTANADVPLQVSENIANNAIPLIVAPTETPQEQVKLGERLSNNHLSAPSMQKQEFAEIINSPGPTSAISTSDHEVSSTQEIAFVSSKRSSASNAVSKSVDLPLSAPIIEEEEAAMVVQNSQIDTTHHFPENSYYMRKRTRKFSDEFIMCENRIESLNNNNKDAFALKQRRKTFSSESCLSAAQYITNNAIFTKHTNTLTVVGDTTAAGTSTIVNSVNNNSGGSSPSTTTEPVIKPAPTRRRNHAHTKRNNTQSPLSVRSRKTAGGAGELNGSFVYNCSHLQPPKTNTADVERCVVLPASAVVPPLNLGNISSAYTKSNMGQVKVFVPPEVEMANEDGEKVQLVATTTSKRGRPVGSGTRNRKKPNTATNTTKAKTAPAVNRRRNIVDNTQKVEDTKAPKEIASAKGKATRAKVVERTSNKKRK